MAALRIIAGLSFFAAVGLLVAAAAKRNLKYAGWACYALGAWIVFGILGSA